MADNYTTSNTRSFSLSSPTPSSTASTSTIPSTSTGNFTTYPVTKSTLSTSGSVSLTPGQELALSMMSK